MLIVAGLRNLLILILLGLLVVFVVQNAATVEVNFLAWSGSLPRAVLYVVIFALGAIVGWLTRFFGREPN
tara:strand:- start:2809 stop:3018 length:210 start_codon:yes stop_codon:yes gene_type:complete